MPAWVLMVLLFILRGLVPAAAEGQFGVPADRAPPPHVDLVREAATSHSRFGIGLLDLARASEVALSSRDSGGLEDPSSFGRDEPLEPSSPAHPALEPRFLPQDVDYTGSEKPGTIIIDTRERLLYLVQPKGRALRYGIGVGRPGFGWSGVKQVSMKREWPDWRPPDDMLKRRPDLPRYMPGGLDNPLGARAIYLGSSLYRIHGSNEPWTIGTAVSSGCFRMRNEDVIDLFNRVKVGARVVVI
jgi:lipoprotein-anchoring transpeptidase ErfK/SrfK